jgi:Zn-dependent M28 family amino/carboxypeptidase
MLKTKTLTVFLVSFCALLFAQKKDNRIEKYAAFIDTAEIRTHIFTLASDSFLGRETGTPSHMLTVNYMKDNFLKCGIQSKTDSAFLQPYTIQYSNRKDTTDKKKKSLSGYNILAFIEGTDLKEEIIVLSAHNDHLGLHDEKIFKGADDDASGTVALLEIAQAFMKAKAEGNGPRRSILFISFSGEEKGLLGSEYYSENPTYPLKNTKCNLNIDMIGRVDDEHKDSINYIYIIGSDMLSTKLHNTNAWCARNYTDLKMDYKYNSKTDPNRYYYRSDHYNFVKKNIPVIFYFNGVHADYHKATDTPEKINIPLMQKRIQYIFSVAWTIANMNEKLMVDVKQKD